MSKKLESPEFKITVGKYVISEGIEVECFSSKETRSDWCRIELSSQFQEIITVNDMAEGIVELGYDGDFDTLINGNVRLSNDDYWKEIMIKDDMIKLVRTKVKATFVDCIPQDILKYLLGCADVKNYILTDEVYDQKKVFVVNNKNCIEAIKELNSKWGITNNFFFQDKIFYYGCKKKQETVYVLSESESILSIQKLGKVWEIETIGIPWIHHSQEIEVNHSKFSGMVEVAKTIVRSDDKGFVRMFIYFEIGE